MDLLVQGIDNTLLELNLMLQREQWYKEQIMSEASLKFIQAIQECAQENIRKIQEQQFKGTEE